MNNKRITVIMHDGWKYTGIQVDQKLSMSGNLEWLKIETKNGIIDINAYYVSAVIRDHADSN